MRNRQAGCGREGCGIVQLESGWTVKYCRKSVLSVGIRTEFLLNANLLSLCHNTDDDDDGDKNSLVHPV
jgi:hypothetical protein